MRLTADHAQLLFGRVPRPLHRLSDGTDAADAVLEVKGPGGRLTLVRLVLPAVSRSVVYLCATDADVIGLSGLSSSLETSPGCTLSGPAGTVLLASGVLCAERVVLPAASVARVDVHLEGERPRVLRNVAVFAGDVASVYIVDVSGDLRSGSASS